ncbi:Shedu immune nuclease family protein [Agrobacterium sp. 22-221-1]
MTDDAEYHWKKQSDRTYISRRIVPGNNEPSMRIASKVFDVDGGYVYAREHDELVLRKTFSGRHEIVVKFTEDDRQIFTLTIQKFNKTSGPSDKYHFSFVGEEIDNLIEFLLNIKNFHFPDTGKVNISDSDLRQIIIDEDQARRVFLENREMIEQLVQSEELTRDIVALGYRRKQLDVFERLLIDAEYFAKQQSRLCTTAEGLWQKFFEKNNWIFGYGLSFSFFSNLDGRGLEQPVVGHSIATVGKRADALLKTQAYVSALCYVEIKRHDTALLDSKAYRSGAWKPSEELSGGVAQSQATVQEAMELYSRKVQPTNSGGDPTGEVVFNFEPKSVLVIGSLNEFQTDNGLNENKYRSFELFRKNLHRPEIVTFDELFHRAKYIVEHSGNQTID